MSELERSPQTIEICRTCGIVKPCGIWSCKKNEMTNGNDPINAQPEHEFFKRTDGAEISRFNTGGLTKREHFAALAMQGLAARQDWAFGSIANHAVEIADALIARLNTESSEAANA